MSENIMIPDLFSYEENIKVRKYRSVLMGVAAALTGTITTKIQQIIRLMRVRGFSMFAFPPRHPPS